ncbi:hypothetical protein NPIL_497601 [Nephila pilipes]|uniref:Uncharacterized protein n=1 Tax=Nephila pilipes TaxID=299642 RepID=A0A8X6UHK2_NEPPI|nr:hypothetical protein NPIL_497601 [Nephila pilipes]
MVDSLDASTLAVSLGSLSKEIFSNSSGFRNGFEEIRKADESDVDISDFENDDYDDDVKDPSSAPLDLQYQFSFE